MFLTERYNQVSTIGKGRSIDDRQGFKFYVNIEIPGHNDFFLTDYRIHNARLG